MASLTYAELVDAAEQVADSLAQLGVGLGDRVGIRITSGTTDLYVAIAGVLVAGAAYVPVDADDPDERARTVFAEAGVAAVVAEAKTREPPTVSDDAWVIFTSGSTGTPKGGRDPSQCGWTGRRRVAALPAVCGTVAGPS